MKKEDMFEKHYTPGAAPKSGKGIFSIKDFGQGHDVIDIIIGVIKGIIS